MTFGYENKENILNHFILNIHAGAIEIEANKEPSE